MESESRPQRAVARPGRLRRSNRLVRPTRRSDTLPYLDPSSPVPTTASSILVVTFDQSASRVLTAWRRSDVAVPKNFAIVDVVDDRENRSPEPTTIRSRGHRVTRVGRNNLQGLGTTIAATLRSWDDPDAAVCFDSVSSLVREVGFDVAVRFFQALTHTVEDLGARGYFYVDPEADDDRTDDALKHLFDETVEHDVSEPTADATSQFERLRREFTASEFRCARCGYDDATGSWQVRSGSERGCDHIRYQRTCPECGALATKDVEL